MATVGNRRLHGVTGRQPRRHNQDAKNETHGKKLSQQRKKVNTIQPRIRRKNTQSHLNSSQRSLPVTPQGAITSTSTTDITTATENNLRQNLPILIAG